MNVNEYKQLVEGNVELMAATVFTVSYCDFALTNRAHSKNAGLTSLSSATLMTAFRGARLKEKALTMRGVSSDHLYVHLRDMLSAQDKFHGYAYGPNGFTYGYSISKNSIGWELVNDGTIDRWNAIPEVAHLAKNLVRKSKGMSLGTLVEKVNLNRARKVLTSGHFSGRELNSREEATLSYVLNTANSDGEFDVSYVCDGAVEEETAIILGRATTMSPSVRNLRKELREYLFGAIGLAEVDLVAANVAVTCNLRRLAGLDVSPVAEVHMRMPNLISIVRSTLQLEKKSDAKAIVNHMMVHQDLNAVLPLAKAKAGDSWNQDCLFILESVHKALEPVSTGWEQIVDNDGFRSQMIMLKAEQACIKAAEKGVQKDAMASAIHRLIQAEETALMGEAIKALHAHGIRVRAWLHDALFVEGCESAEQVTSIVREALGWPEAEFSRKELN